MNAEMLWRQVCRAIRPTIAPALYRACFTGTQAVDLRDDRLIVLAPTATMRDVLGRRFTLPIERLAPSIWPRPIRVRFIHRGTVQAHPGAETVTPGNLRSMPHESETEHLFAELTARYTFTSFVEGESNRLAYAAARDVVAHPGARYNPLFIYGGVGLGKTHLLLAIGHTLRATGTRVGYVAAETFADEMLSALRNNRLERFRATYRSVDLLLVDDIQFIGGREHIEDAFFHIFNDLHMAGKQIVLTSDRAPRAIPTLHARLRTRFEWGLLADVAAPDYAHRRAIVEAKTAGLSHAIPGPVRDIIAKPEDISVRALEGAINRVVLTAEARGAPVTLALAAATLGDYLGAVHWAELEPALVIELVVEYYHLSRADLLGKSRNRAHVWPRQVAMYLMRETTRSSLSQIGAALGGRDHTTIMHGCEQVVDQLRVDEEARRAVEYLRAQIRAASGGTS